MKTVFNFLFIALLFSCRAFGAVQNVPESPAGMISGGGVAATDGAATNLTLQGTTTVDDTLVFGGVSRSTWPDGSEGTGGIPAEDGVATNLTVSSALTIMDDSGTSYYRIESYSNGGFLIGAPGAGTIGSDALENQYYRADTNHIASGTGSWTWGMDNTASGEGACAWGYQNAVTGLSGFALGMLNKAQKYSVIIGVNIDGSGGENGCGIGEVLTVDGQGSLAVGRNGGTTAYDSVSMGMVTHADGTGAAAVGHHCTASGEYSTAFGLWPTAYADYSGAYGNRVKVRTPYVQELGYWVDNDTRTSAVRLHQTGMVASTIEQSDTAFTASPADNGAEADNSLASGMFAFRLSADGTEIYVDVNVGGTIKTGSISLQ